MTKPSKVKTKKQKERDRIYEDALRGNKAAMRTLRDVYDYVVITVKGKPVNLRRL